MRGYENQLIDIYDYRVYIAYTAYNGILYQAKHSTHVIFLFDFFFLFWLLFNIINTTS